MRRIALAALLTALLPASAFAQLPAPTLTAEGSTLRWTTVSGATSYHVQSVTWTVEPNDGSSPYSYLERQATSATTTTVRCRDRPSYSRVQAIGPEGASAWSNTVHTPACGAAAAGRVRFRLDAKSYFDPYHGETAWIRGHIARIMGYPPAADNLTSVVPTLGYHDAYTTWGAHSLNPQHRAEYVAKVQHDRGVGYAGTFMDDIEWEGSGQHEPGSNAEVAALIEAVRGALGPSGILELNTQYVDLRSRLHDPYVERALRVTNMVDKEFGVSSSSGINDAAGYAAFLRYVDELRTLYGVHIDLVSSAADDEYSEATYFLLNDDGDFLGGHATPSEWWSGWDVNLGAGGTRSVSGTLYRRDFAGGRVYINAPGGSTQTIALGKTMRTAGGSSLSSVTLPGRSGVVLSG